MFAVPTLFGLEGLCADEMRRLNIPEVRAENGRVLCGGTQEELARLNLNLRTGERVLIVLGSFPADTFDALFEGTKALPWERFIPRDGQFPVKGHSLNSGLHSVPTCQAMIKKAVAAGIRKMNFATDICYAFLDTCLEELQKPDRAVAVDNFMKKPIEAVKNFAMTKILLAGAQGKAL